MKENFGSFFAGFDMVGQEDKGGPLLQFVPQLLEASAQGLPFFFHSGETGWRGTPIDENLFDAILLNTTRIGHGYALAQYPHLMEMAEEKGIAVELCPISNQVGDQNNSHYIYSSYPAPIPHSIIFLPNQQHSSFASRS